MFTITNSVPQCAARMVKHNPKLLEAHAKLIAEYVTKQKLKVIDAADDQGVRAYVTVITGRTVAENVYHAGDVLVTEKEPSLDGAYCLYSFKELR